MLRNGYAELHPVGIEVRADMLESVAGIAPDDMDKECLFAEKTLDWNDPGSLRWIAALAARRIAELES